MENFRLPRKLPTYRHLLHAQYTRDRKSLLRDTVGLSRALINEETVYDNWDGGTYGHDVQLFLPMEELCKIDINDINSVTRIIREDLNKLSNNVRNEFFANVHLELFDENDEDCQRARPLNSRPDRDADTLSIWRPDMIRLFISHRDSYKVHAHDLARSLESYGISSFVAHDAIQPMSIWQGEIEKGLETMEAMLAFVTSDFHESIWANQEIGFALGQNIPIVSLKVQGRDPEGFIGRQQALKCRLDNVGAAVPEIFNLLSKRIGNSQRVQNSLIQAFLLSPNFQETNKRFDRMRKAVSELSDFEIKKIVNGFQSNDQLHKAFCLRDEATGLCDFLNSVTGKTFVMRGTTIASIEDNFEDDIPF